MNVPVDSQHITHVLLQRVLAFLHAYLHELLQNSTKHGWILVKAYTVNDGQWYTAKQQGWTYESGAFQQLFLLVDMVEHDLRIYRLPQLLQLRLSCLLDVHFSCDLYDQVQGLCNLILRQQADLQIEIGPLVVEDCHAILADKHKSGKENCLH